VIERAGEEMQTAGRSCADIVGSQNLSQGAVPLPHARFGATVRLLDPTLSCCIPKRLRILQCVRSWMPFLNV
jgi:hypothetical protein